MKNPNPIAMIVVALVFGLTSCDGGKATLPFMELPTFDLEADTSVWQHLDLVAEPEIEVTPSPETIDYSVADSADAEITAIDLLEPGEFGWPCQDNDDCLSGYCVWVGTEKLCTSTCVDECPADWSCVQDTSALPDLLYVCLPAGLTQCLPCTSNQDCHVSGVDTGSRCVDFGTEGAYCGALCQKDDDCLVGYACTQQDLLEGGVSSQCTPDNGQQCECNDYAVAVGAWTDCSIANDFGQCPGTRNCDDGGLSACDAQLPAPEECNGLDDNCDGDADEDLATTTCGEGECLHTVANCLDGVQQECDPLEGAVDESCNSKDDDCDGQTDEDFSDLNDDGIPDCISEDDDGDGVLDQKDNCPTIANEDQADFDLDGIGNACDGDDDNDNAADEDDCNPFNPQIHPAALEACNGLDDDCNELVDDELGSTTCGLGMCEHTIDNCVNGQSTQCEPMEGTGPEECDGLDNDCDGQVDQGHDDLDQDGHADCVDPDDDGDEVDDESDNCPTVDNPDQTDTDLDGFGDVCDFGCYLEGIDQWEEDCDGIPDEMDNCPAMANEDQADTDGDLTGNECDLDDDNDSIPDGGDNCQLVVNPGQSDLDGDGVGDACDGDLDGDGVGDDDDNCPELENPDQLDADGDALGDVCDPDDDNDMDPDMLDCAKFDDAVSHFAMEICNQIDDDCDNMVDESGAIGCEPWYVDMDLDGFGVESQSKCLCGPEDLYTVDVLGDCGPLDNTIFPGAMESCNGKDDDCNSAIDELFPDLDGDGIADCVDTDDDGDEVADVLDNCPAIVNASQGDFDKDGQGNSCDDDDDNDSSPDTEDCAPFDTEVNPNLPEVCDGKDNDCNGPADDGLGTVECGLGECGHAVAFCVGGQVQECDPMEGAQQEACDGLDNNCDGDVDEDYDVGQSCEAGQGQCADEGIKLCLEDGTGTFCSAELGQADDELCDGLDNDCDGDADEDFPLGEACSNGVGECIQDGLTVCSADGSGVVCDALPGNPVPEVCDGKDNDCDNQADEELGTTTCGLNQCENTIPFCVDGLVQICNPFLGAEGETCDGQDNNCDGKLPEDEQDVDKDGMMACAGDCNDFNNSVYEGADELCDGIDSNCDGSLVDGFDNFDKDIEPDCIDDDDDNDGDSDVNDCAPYDPAIYSGAKESCDDVDSDCDKSLVDEFDNFDNDTEPDCIDADDDNDGDADVTDCNDNDKTIYTDAPELCDGIDSNCNNSLVDQYDNFDNDTEPDCVDADDDNDGDNDVTDCNDADKNIYTGAPELCDTVDSDCDNDLVDGYDNFDGDTEPDCIDDDDDNDGSKDVDDCEPLNPAINPGATEICDGLDNDCSGVADDNVGACITYYLDADSDGYGTAASQCLCSPSGNYKATNTGDCNDANGSINPGVAEVCKNVTDENCSGAMSEGCPEVFHNCGGPSAMDSGQTINCNLGSKRLVHKVKVSVGCNDGESGSYSLSFDDGSSTGFGASCNSTHGFSARVSQNHSLHMNSGGGGDNHISFTCCGSSGWGLYYR